MEFRFPNILLGGSWVVLSRAASAPDRDTSIVAVRIALLLLTHEPPSRVLSLGFKGLGV